MKRKFLKKPITLFLALLVLLSLCSCRKQAEVIVSDSPVISPGQSDTQEETADESLRNTLFAIRFVPSQTLNPITCSDVYNDAVLSLMYEGLFRLDKHFQPINVLCDSYTSEDGKQFYFKLINTVMHDGDPLTAEDAAYSINLARSYGKYAARLSNLAFCGVTEDGLLDIRLTNSDYSFPALLDIPIIRNGTGKDYAPVGTGPYVYKESGDYHHLTAFSDYRDYDSLPYNAVYLRNISDSKVVENFDNNQLSLIWDDPLDENPVNLHAGHEIRSYDTTILQYIGFNSHSTPMNDVNLRRAVACAVDREYIVNEIFKSTGRAAPLILNSGYYAYSTLWEELSDYSEENIRFHLDEANLKDENGDGYLEYPVFGEYQPMFITFIAYSGNSQKLEAARSIAEKLQNAGLYIDFQELSWDDYQSALNNGLFDLYYTEASLPQNFDFSLILSPEGSLDFGEMGSEENDLVCRAFLDATTEENKLSAAKTLCTAISDNAAIVPIMYRQYTVYTHRGMISDFTPTVSGIFSNVTEWIIHK